VLLLGAIEQIHLIDEDVVGAVVADMGLDTDIMPQSVAPSTLDTVEDAEDVVDAPVANEIAESEAAVAETSWPDIAEDESEETPVDTAIDPEDAAVDDFMSRHFGDTTVAEDHRADDEAVELDAAWQQAEWAAVVEEPVVDADDQETSEVQDVVEPVDADDAQEDIASPELPSDNVAPFARPTFVAFAPRLVKVDAEPAEDAPAAVQEAVSEVEPFAEVEAPEEMEAFAALGDFAPSDDQPIAAPDIDALRADMLSEIEALRAEIASLRAVQSHAPFGQPVAQSEVDPEALKGCFTLVEERLSALEFRAEEQDTALRRVLTLLVDWVEREEQMADQQAGVAA
jgi:hypothetical protein